MHGMPPALAWCGARRVPVHEPFLPHHRLPRHPQDNHVHNFPTDWRISHASYHSPAWTAYGRLHAALRQYNSSSILSLRHLCVTPVGLLLAGLPCLPSTFYTQFIFPQFQNPTTTVILPATGSVSPGSIFSSSYSFFFLSAPLLVDLYKHRRKKDRRPRNDRRSRSPPPFILLEFTDLGSIFDIHYCIPLKNNGWPSSNIRYQSIYIFRPDGRTSLGLASDTGNSTNQ
ncbi:hypothetical protein F5883DRAFT_80992 [Diaporthe sp. PMI_573]|jgi:hypothetical protein|nr:hypothetical protein F5883DRAFT_80992 [Diaporthaceae sp. PMI_573]